VAVHMSEPHHSSFAELSPCLSPRRSSAIFSCVTTVDWNLMAVCAHDIFLKIPNGFAPLHYAPLANSQAGCPPRSPRHMTTT
jgi:hypothetical protein